MLDNRVVPCHRHRGIELKKREEKRRKRRVKYEKGGVKIKGELLVNIGERRVRLCKEKMEGYSVDS